MNDWKAMLELSKIKAPRTPYRAQLRLPKVYLRAVAIMLALWLGGLVALKWGLAASGREMKDMTDLIQHGCFWIVLGLSLLFAAHTLIICMLESAASCVTKRPTNNGVRMSCAAPTPC